MAYNDNYPNGYKSGYSSADDPDRKDYSPQGLERAMMGNAGSGIYEESEVEKYWENQRKKQEEREAQRWQEIDERKKNNIRREQEFEAARIIKSQRLETYNKQSWFKKFIAKAKGEDLYKKQSELYEQALEEAKAMTDIELTSFIKYSGNGRTR